MTRTKMSLHVRPFLSTSLACIATALALASPVRADEPSRIDIYPPAIQLDSVRSRIQLVVTGHFPNGELRDLTGTAVLQCESPQIATIDGSLVVPRADGDTQLTVTVGSQRAVAPISVRGADRPSPVGFHAEVLAALTKQGCNAGSCHGAPEGKGGFVLSMLAYAPRIDEESLIHGGLGRRIDPLEPDESLLLKKPMLRVTHVGGKRLRKSDASYRVLRNWIYEGARPDPEGTPECRKIVVYPGPSRVLRMPDAQQQLSVLAHFQSGRTRDVTRIATFDSTNKEVATVDADGLVVGRQRGLAAVTVRYLDFVESIYFTVEQAVDGFAWNEPVENGPIDRLVNTKLRQMQYLPSDVCDDATFIRRVHLDLTGLLPSAEKSRAFLADTSAGKRDALIDQLLQTEEFARYWASKTADRMRVNPNTMKDGRAQLFSQWLVDSYRRNQPYDQFVRQLLTAVGDTHEVGPANYFVAFPKSDEVAETTAQLFMGSRINCAKCHNHPFESWTQDDYYRIAAAFARVKQEGDEIDVADSGEARHPATGAAMKPWGVEAVTEDVAGQADRRAILATWLTRSGNPYFARVEANRIWGELLGRGIVYPVDDFRSSNPPSNPELLDWLAAEFEKSGYDRKQLIRQICRSATYQRRSSTNRFNQDDRSLFSHYLVRRLTAEQLQDAVGYATRTLTSTDQLAVEIEAMQSELGSITRRLANEHPVWETRLRETVISKNCWQSAWWHVGPFPEGDYDKAVRTEYPPEQKINFDAKLPQRLKWRTRAEWTDGKQHAFPNPRPGVHYVTRRIVATRPGKAVLSFGSDDGLRVWLNGSLVLDKPTRRGIKDDDDRLEIDLREGANTLLLKVIDAGGYTGFFFRLIEFDGQPPDTIDLPLDLAELLAIPAERRSESQQRRIVEHHEATQPRIKQLREQLRRLDDRLDYHTQRAVPEHNDFLVAFGQPKRETACACERQGEPTIDQTLQTLNGRLVWDRTLSGVEHYQRIDDDAKLLEQLFLSALSRPPAAHERDKLLAYVKSKPNRFEAIQDVLWVMVNLQEFLFQH